MVECSECQDAGIRVMAIEKVVLPPRFCTQHSSRTQRFVVCNCRVKCKSEHEGGQMSCKDINRFLKWFHHPGAESASAIDMAVPELCIEPVTESDRFAGG